MAVKSTKKQKAISKAKEKATKFVQKGNYDKALDEYKILTKLDPNDLRFRMKLGECLSKLNRKNDAIKEYRKVLDLYAEKGFLIQAIAVGKVILQLDPSLDEIEDQLADLNARRGLGPPKRRKIMPALSLKGVEGPIPSAVKEEELEKPSPVEPPSSEAPGDAAIALPDTEDEQDSMPDIAGEEEGDFEEGGDELTMTPEEEEALYSSVDDIMGDEDEDIEEEEAEEEEEEDESEPIALDEAPDDMADVEEPAPSEPDLPPMPEIMLFSDLNVDEFKRVMQKFQIGNLPKGITVIKEGTRGDSFYILAEGKVRVYKWSKNKKKKLTLATLDAGAFFGEFAFLTKSIRSASIETTEDCVLLRINRRDLDEVIADYPRIREVLDDFYRKRVLDTLLQISPLFEGLSDSDRQELINRFESVMLDTGDTIIREGEEGRGLYLIKNGAIGITRKHPDTGEEIQLAILREGDFFGEISLLHNKPTTANCTALVPTDLFKLSKSAFQEMIMMHPQILEVMSVTADERMRDTQKSLTAKMKDRQSSGMV